MMNENGFDIMLKKPNNNHKYILEADPTIIEQEKQHYQDNKRELMVNHFLSNKQRRGIRIPSFMKNNNGASVNNFEHSYPQDRHQTTKIPRFTEVSEKPCTNISGDEIEDEDML